MGFGPHAPFSPGVRQMRNSCGVLIAAFCRENEIAAGMIDKNSNVF